MRRGRRTAATNRRRTTRLGYVGGAVIQPNAQVCRRLAGASLECSPPPLSSPFLPVGWAVGLGPSARCPPSRVFVPLPPKPPIVPLRAPSSLRGPAVVPRLHHPPLPSPITARKRKCERTGERACDVFVCGKCVCACVYAPRRRYVTSSHGNQCSWPPTRSHGAKPTRPASFGHLCASAPLTCLSLFLFFLIFLPLLFAAARPFLFPRAISVSSFSFFLRSFLPARLFVSSRVAP